MLYTVLVRLIERGATEGLQDKIDVFFATDRLTEGQYQMLTARLNENA